MRDIYQETTDKIIAALERGTVPWHCPWSRYKGFPKNLVSGKEYRGANVFLLTVSRMAEGYESPHWLTYKQAQEKGGNVRKGERGTLVIFWKLYDKPTTEIGEDGKPKVNRFPVLRHYTVFNAAQCDGVEIPADDEIERHEWDAIETAEDLASRWNGPTIEHGGDAACYLPSEDLVRMPQRDRFEHPGEYYSTLFHELTHSTGHETRLARPGITNPTGFGTDPYGREELVAEMGAAFLCGHCGIDTTTEHNAAYLDGWLNMIKGDPKLVIQAAGQAQKAADLIVGRTFAETEETATA